MKFMTFIITNGGTVNGRRQVSSLRHTFDVIEKEIVEITEEQLAQVKFVQARPALRLPLPRPGPPLPSCSAG